MSVFLEILEMRASGTATAGTGSSGGIGSLFCALTAVTIPTASAIAKSVLSIMYTFLS